jgi:hypothetical protein
MLTSPEFHEARKAYLGLTPGPVQNEVMGILHNSADSIQMRSCVTLVGLNTWEGWVEACLSNVFGRFYMGAEGARVVGMALRVNSCLEKLEYGCLCGVALESLLSALFSVWRTMTWGNKARCTLPWAFLSINRCVI